MDKGKISDSLKEIVKVSKDLKEIRKSLRTMEKITTDHYVELKVSVKDMKVQMTEIEIAFKNELLKDNEYKTLVEMKMKQEEELAGKKQQLRVLLNEGFDTTPAEFDVETDEGMILAHVMPEKKLYINGKAQK